MKNLESIAICICFLLIFNEFATGHLQRFQNSENLREIQRKNVITSTGVKRFSWSGAAKTLLQYAFKGFQVGSKYFHDVTSLISIISTVYTIIEPCENTEYGRQAKKYNDIAKTTSMEIDSGSSTINVLQLETKNIQSLVEYLNYNFNGTLEEMHEAGQLSEELLEIVDKDIAQALNVTTLEIEKMLLEAQETGASIDYGTVAKTYWTRIDKTVKLAIPTFTILMPRIPKMLKLAKERLRNVNSFKLTKRFKNIKLPTLKTKLFRGLNSWFSKTQEYIKTKKTALRTFMTGKYEKALKVVKGVGKAFAGISHLMFAAFDIYTAIQNFGRTDCKKILNEAKRGYDEVMKANATYTEILNNVTEAKKEMLKIEDELVKVMSSEVFLEDLANMNENMKEIQGDGKGMQGMIDATEMYISKMPNNTDMDEIVVLASNLYENAIGSLPFVYRCLKDRAGMVRHIVDECKEGDRTLQRAIEAAKVFYNYRIEQCTQRIAIPYFTDESLEQMAIQAAKDQGFNKECRLNRKETIDEICDYYCDGRSPERISRLLRVSIDGVNNTITSCSDCEMTKLFEAYICLMKKDKETTVQIREELPQFTVDQIEAVDCREK